MTQGKHRPMGKSWLARLIRDRTLTTLDFDDNMLLVFLDETGIGKISADHPLFGMGGCVLTGKDYRNLEVGWHTLKKVAFGLDPHAVFHSADDLNFESLPDKNLNMVVQFFTSYKFLRVCHFVDTSFISFADEETTWNNAVNVVASGIRDTVMMRVNEPVESDRWIIESSDRMSATIESCLIANAQNYFFYPQAHRHFGHWYMDKKLCVPGLEIADLILYVDQKRRRGNLPARTACHDLHDVIFSPATAASGSTLRETAAVWVDPADPTQTTPPKLLVQIKGPRRDDKKPDK